MHTTTLLLVVAVLLRATTITAHAVDDRNNSSSPGECGDETQCATMMKRWVDALKEELRQHMRVTQSLMEQVQSQHLLMEKRLEDSYEQLLTMPRGAVLSTMADGTAGGIGSPSHPTPSSSSSSSPSAAKKYDVNSSSNSSSSSAAPSSAWSDGLNYGQSWDSAYGISPSGLEAMAKLILSYECSIHYTLSPKPTSITEIFDALNDIYDYMTPKLCPLLSAIPLQLFHRQRRGDIREVSIVVDNEHYVAPPTPVIIFSFGALEYLGPWPWDHNESPDSPDEDTIVAVAPKDLQGYACHMVWAGNKLGRECLELQEILIKSVTVLPGVDEGISISYVLSNVLHAASTALLANDLYSRDVLTATHMFEMEPKALTAGSAALLVKQVRIHPLCVYMQHKTAHEFMSLFVDRATVPTSIGGFAGKCIFDQMPDFHDMHQNLMEWSMQGLALVSGVLVGDLSVADMEPFHRLLGLASTLLVDYITALVRRDGTLTNVTKQYWCLLPPDQRGIGAPECGDEAICAILALPWVQEEDDDDIARASTHTTAGEKSYHGCLHDLREYLLLPNSSTVSELIRGKCVPTTNLGNRQNTTTTTADGTADSRVCTLTSAMKSSNMLEIAEIVQHLVTWLVDTRVLEIHQDIAAGHIAPNRGLVEQAAIPLYTQYIHEAEMYRQQLEEWPKTKWDDANQRWKEDTRQKSAVCVVGSLRSVDVAWQSNLPLLRSLGSVDFFLYLMDDEMTAKALLLRPTMLVLRNDSAVSLEGVPPLYLWGEEGATERAVQQYLALKQCGDLIANYSARTGIEYDWYVRYRPDSMHPYTLDLNELSKDVVYTGTRGYEVEKESEFMDDFFTIGSKQNMQVLFSHLWTHCLRGVEPYRQAEGNWITESMLKACHDHYNVTVVTRKDWTISVVRIGGACGTFGCW